MGNPMRSRRDVQLVSTPDDTRLGPDRASALQENVQANRREELAEAATATAASPPEAGRPQLEERVPD
jgi:hypothetical protein